MKSLREQEQHKLKIYINCFIFIYNRCMTYLSKSWTPNDSIYSFTHCKAVTKLTVSNGLSLQTFISQCMISCNWWFQMGGSLSDLPIFIYYGYMCIVLYIYIWKVFCVIVCISTERERDLKSWNALHMRFPSFLSCHNIYIYIYAAGVVVFKASVLDWLGVHLPVIYICSVMVCKASILNWLERTYTQLHCAMLIYLV